RPPGRLPPARRHQRPGTRTVRARGGRRVSERVGFFTDTTLCIGCKACEVACKEWNGVPDDGLNFLGQSYDNTGELGANTWRHVAFVEKSDDGHVKWLMSSDVCKHCTEAACLDV